MAPSRSTSPAPAVTPSKRGGSPEGDGALSSDALYTPLTAYAGCSAGATPSKKKNVHSLSLQMSSSLRESSLVTFLSSVGKNLKTSHPYESQIYRGMGGSVARFGMGDNDRADGSMRSVLEGKLSNRSLVLVGGGVHSRAPSKSLGNDDGDGNAKDLGVVGLGIAKAAGRGKRERKRVGGIGIFGSISNKKRKKMLRRVIEKCKERNDNPGLKVCNGFQGESSNEKVDTSNKRGGDMTQKDTQAKVGTVIKTLHDMWLNYIQQLLSCTEVVQNATAIDGPSLTWEDKNWLSTLLATAEHVGMPVTISECPSRPHLVPSRCIVVDETLETWRVAMIVTSQKRSIAAVGAPKGAALKSHSCDGKGEAGKQVIEPCPSWKIVMVPKCGTSLEIDLPLEQLSSSDDLANSPRLTKGRRIRIRLRT
ncbi:hypothetical protein ACHAWF_013735 [Thalassiosira exigua]